jgi:hypothetical protein
VVLIRAAESSVFSFCWPLIVAGQVVPPVLSMRPVCAGQYVAYGLENLVVVVSSLAVNCRQRRAKTDLLGEYQQLRMPLRHVAGERNVWRVVVVPNVQCKDRRPLHYLLCKRGHFNFMHFSRIEGIEGRDDLMECADGVHSRIRRLAFGPENRYV